MKPFLVACGLAALTVSAFVTPAMAGSTGLHVIDTLKIGGTGGWDYASFDSVTGKVFLSHGTSIASVDTRTGKINPHLADANGVHAALPLGDGKTLLMTEGKANKATFVDAETGVVLSSLTTAAKPDGAVIDPATGKIFVLDNGGAQLDVLDAKTHTSLGKVALGGAPEGSAVDGNGLLFVHYEDTRQIAVIDTKALKVKATYDIKDCDGPTGLVFVPGQRLLLSACDGGLARVTNADTGVEVATLAIGDRPDYALYDDKAKLGYIPSGDGKLTVISFDGKPHVVDTITTKAGARTGALDPETGRLYLPTADFAAANPVNARWPCQTPLWYWSSANRRSPVPGLGLKRVAGLALMALLAGCASYVPAPLQVADLGEPLFDSTPLPKEEHALLKLALERNPGLAAAGANLASAEQAAKSARNLPALSVTLTAEYSKDADAARPWLYGGSVGVPVDAGGRRAARVTSADLAVIKARYALSDAAWNVRQQLRQSMADLATSGDEIAATQGLLDQRRAYQALIERRVAAGEDAQGLLIQARLDASAPLNTLLQAQARQAQARATLARLFNVPLKAIDVLVVEGLKIEGLPVTALIDTTPDQLATLADRALYIRADVLNAVADYDMAENDLRLAVAGQFPDLNIAPGYTWERGVVKLPVNLNLTLPPLDFNRANIAQAQLARLAAGKMLEGQVKTAQAEIRQASLIYDADRATALRTRETDLPMARDLAKRLAKMQAAGEADRTETLTADISAAQAHLAAITTTRTVSDDRLKLEDALRQAFDAEDNLILTEAMQPKGKRQ